MVSALGAGSSDCETWVRPAASSCADGGEEELPLLMMRRPRRPRWGLEGEPDGTARMTLLGIIMEVENHRFCGGQLSSQGPFHPLP